MSRGWGGRQCKGGVWCGGVGGKGKDRVWWGEGLGDRRCQWCPQPRLTTASLTESQMMKMMILTKACVSIGRPRSAIVLNWLFAVLGRFGVPPLFVGHVRLRGGFLKVSGCVSGDLGGR